MDSPPFIQSWFLYSVFSAFLLLSAAASPFSANTQKEKKTDYSEAVLTKFEQESNENSTNSSPISSGFEYDFNCLNTEWNCSGFKSYCYLGVCYKCEKDEIWDGRSCQDVTEKRKPSVDNLLDAFHTYIMAITMIIIIGTVFFCVCCSSRPFDDNLQEYLQLNHIRQKIHAGSQRYDVQLTVPAA